MINLQLLLASFHGDLTEEHLFLKGLAKHYVDKYRNSEG